jgi:hypothetical protein
MGSVQRARGWIHSGEQRLFGGKDRTTWTGRYSWLHVVFNKPLPILGLGLGETEVFLRWLLIERARYFAKFPKRAQKAWSVHKPDAGGEAAKLIGRSIDDQTANHQNSVAHITIFATPDHTAAQHGGEIG